MDHPINAPAFVKIMKHKKYFNTVDDRVKVGKTGFTSVCIEGVDLQVKSNDVLIKDKLITLNNLGAENSGYYSGIEIAESGSSVGYLKTNYDRDGWVIKAPLTSEAEIFTTAGGVINRAVTLKSTLYVSGTSIFNNNLTITSNLNVAGNSTLQGSTTILSSLNVAGNSTLQGSTTIISSLHP